MLALPSGSWLTGFLPAVSVIAAGTGISWAIAGADYSRYQSPSSSSKSIFAAVMGGACLPLMLLMLAGILLSVQLPDLASAASPIALIGSVLPARMAILICWPPPPASSPSRCSACIPPALTC